MLSVVTFLWHDESGRWNKFLRYSPEHVNRLAAMVRANLAMPHQLVVVTDQAGADFDSRIKVVPLWPDARELGGCWCRLKAFDRETALLLGERLVSIDLDCVVTGDLTPLFDRNEDAVFWAASTANTPYNGSMWMLTAGARQQVWDRFDPSTAPGIVRDEKRMGTDQAWISHVLSDEVTWRRSDGVLRFRGDCERGLPEGSRIVFFPGRPKPNDTLTRMMHPWIEERLPPVPNEALYTDRRSEAHLPRMARRALRQVRVLEAKSQLSPQMERRLAQAKAVLVRGQRRSGARARRPSDGERSKQPGELQEPMEPEMQPSSLHSTIPG